MYKEFLATTAIVLTFLMYVPYIRSIHQGRTKPHAFSWIIWTTTTSVVFLAQFANNGGAGAWAIGASGLFSAYVAVLAFWRRTDTSITRTDWAFLAIAMAAIPCWLLASNPLLAVVLLTGIELAGFAPMFRSGAIHPNEERIGFFTLGAARNLLAAGALKHYSLITVLFPVAKGIACLALATIVWHRRNQLLMQKAGK